MEQRSRDGSVLKATVYCVCLTFDSLDSNFYCFVFLNALRIGLVDDAVRPVEQNVGQLQIFRRKLVLRVNVAEIVSRGSR